VCVKAEYSAIIGIGASAGGLDALEQFFTNIPPNSGLAFVVVQHLYPNHEDLLPELLQRITPMKVMQIHDRMAIKANCIYVICPNKDLSILHGKLFLLDLIEPRGLHLPIDSFFKALADDQHERAIGVIFSGMGSDGTLGLRAIKENAGLTVVQTPESAQFDAMPCSAIDAGLADMVAPPQGMWERISAFLNHRPRGLHAVAEPMSEIKAQSGLEQIIILLRERSGNDFSLYKKNTLYRRIERRMGLHQIDAIVHYVRYLRENPQELDLLFKELLIGVTHFFRDPEVWEMLKTIGIPTQLKDCPIGNELRAWVPACSTGEEAYSLAIAFKEALAQSQSQQAFTLKIFATDLNHDAIDFARQGFYPASIAANVSTERLARFFTTDGKGYQVNKDIREMVLFASQNVIMDPPFTKLNILSCRNLLIYLDVELQKKLLPLFHFALTANGILLLGNAEAISGFSHLFTVLDSKSRLYQRSEHLLPTIDVDFPKKYFPVAALAKASPIKPNPVANLQALADQLLLQHYSPASVLVNADGDILYISGRTGKYLEPAAGKANWNIHAMARDGLNHIISSALKKAQHQPEAVRLLGLTIGNDGDKHTINLTVQAIAKPEALSGMLIVVFTDVPTPPTERTARKSTSSQKNLQTELQLAREELQSLREDMQASHEELQSANEELQSTNEELQSSNEELMTSKEEMQSLNEELQTLNAELQTKVDDCSQVSNDMNNLLNSMEIATVFLDNTLKIRRFTSHTRHVFKLIAADVGRPLSDIVTDLDYPQLQQDVQDVLRTLMFTEKQVQACDHRWFKVRVMPYHMQNKLIDGVVITFIDITETKNLEAKLRINHE
jgi:chemotaxis protein methyltransferase CheR/two-component system CheB/CheR fusion protein